MARFYDRVFRVTEAEQQALIAMRLRERLDNLKPGTLADDVKARCKQVPLWELIAGSASQKKVAKPKPRR